MNKNEEILYRRVQKGKTCRYELVTEQPEPVTTVTFTDEQCITAAGALGVVLMMVFERIIPPHKLVARKIKAVEAAILDLYRGTGQALDEDVAEQMCRTWDQTMKIMSGDEKC